MSAKRAKTDCVQESTEISDNEGFGRLDMAGLATARAAQLVRLLDTRPFAWLIFLAQWLRERYKLRVVSQTTIGLQYVHTYIHAYMGRKDRLHTALVLRRLHITADHQKHTSCKRLSARQPAAAFSQTPPCTAPTFPEQSHADSLSQRRFLAS